MEGNTNYYENPMPEYQPSAPDTSPPQSQGLSTAALAMGIVSLVLICCGASFILGALGILFALLSRGRGRMTGTAKAGMILSIIGSILCIVVYTFYAVNFVTSGQFDDAMDSYEYFYEYDTEEFEDLDPDDYSDFYEFDDGGVLDEDVIQDLLQNNSAGGEL